VEEAERARSEPLLLLRGAKRLAIKYKELHPNQAQA
jgi:hypothetical protein